MDSDDMPALSADTLAVLQSFLEEKKEQDERFAKLQENADEVFQSNQKIDMSLFQEDWQLSQFWYDDATADFIAERAYQNTSDGDHIAFISSPTAYVAFRNKYSRDNAFVFEFDSRFDVFKDQFVHYDFNQPLGFARAADLKHKFKFIVADPPFLNEDCLSQTMETARFLAADGAKIMIDTGAIMEDLAAKLVGAKITNFRPAHKGGLSNEFRCYSTFEDDELTWLAK
ncbi:Protein-lysine N-methyltransferase efm5 [Coemansia sp. RSA 2706]|nr:Protein-lysine N-methyltransferase efm5 [Coemansia sp. RSA 2711]KAJ1849480.1 Protein-lysine N-methyltransferase efm5 [Coemansia sp. RSA 2708]KAJ2290206.1 Protein-lysine N-methyltransferase efm5 [Coemansia sp. RSA 2706]KAJ2300478.1 Protein-lysine N-methyltransferase efm5 [Coemansia sp. RSA 2705]KAJ2306527.1 Protein-lysine N-methyltransferase efm5 [Coemansia sp. RSA 2704]KAJ2316770.1 Protein-lysine N-methyltransferase efm5 [Coemansia sp. RSA 2702]KAJ2358256.1 Protein-lysine N-methyltransfera